MADLPGGKEIYLYKPGQPVWGLVGTNALPTYRIELLTFFVVPRVSCSIQWGPRGGQPKYVFLNYALSTCLYPDLQLKQHCVYTLADKICGLHRRANFSRVP